MTAVLLDWVAPAFLILAAAGSFYAIVAVLLLGRFAARPLPRASRFPSVTVLKPLHGAEPGLYDNLLSFCRQDYLGPVQIVFGVRDVRDPAVPVVRRLMADLPQADLELVVDATEHGANGKISNLVNMARLIRHELVVVADSDIRVDAGYLSHLAGALEQPGVGLATCLYRGVAAEGSGAASPPMGSTTTSCRACSSGSASGAPIPASAPPWRFGARRCAGSAASRPSPTTWPTTMRSAMRCAGQGTSSRSPP
jgi:Glycosyltransferases, probably involved in cell wall biogenesis